MKSIWTVCSICVMLFYALGAHGQQEIAIGDWKAYVPFNMCLDVTQSPNYIYAAAERGIAQVDKSDLTVRKITKVDGLSDTEPVKLVFEPSTQTLVIAYKNGNIDLMTSEGITNMPNVFANSAIIEQKLPNRARIDENGHAYIAYNFGLVQLNVANSTFGFSLITDFPIFDFVAFDNKYYFSSEEGIYWADANSNINHADLSVWNRFESGWPSEYFSRAIIATAGKLFCDVNGSLYEIRSSEPFLIQEAKEDYYIRSLSSINGKVGVSFYYDFNAGGFRIDEFFILRENGDQIVAFTRKACSLVNYGAIEDEQGRIFYANEASGITYLESIDSGCSNLSIPGPPNSDAFEVAFRGNEILVAGGELGDGGAPNINRTGILSYKDGVWDQFNHTDGFFGDSVRTYTDIAVGPEGQIVAGTFFEGIVSISSDWQDVSVINKNNSCLSYQSLLNWMTISDVTYDNRGNLWISNYRANDPLKMIDRDGVCHSFPRSSTFRTNNLTEIAIDERGYKWIASFGSESALVVFDEGDLDDPLDDRHVDISNSNSEIEDNIIRDIKVDLDGDVWVGTDRGVVVFECASAIFTTGCSGRKPIVEVDGVPALLLENERIRAIAVDGANRKWFGSSNGIFVQSDNGEEEILRFDERNSPLISNFIRDIAINPETGEVLISTDKGLMSYRTDATDGGSVHATESEVFAFPNPVRPEYDGPIALKGLPRDARVKITDIQGKLVFEGEANGGEAIWNGKDYNGRRAASGVYLVFSTSQSSFDKPDALVSKILIVN